MYLAALQCILSEYCDRDRNEFIRTVSVTQSFPSINNPTFLVVELLWFEIDPKI